MGQMVFRFSDPAKEKGNTMPYQEILKQICTVMVDINLANGENWVEPGKGLNGMTEYPLTWKELVREYIYEPDQSEIREQFTLKKLRSLVDQSGRSDNTPYCFRLRHCPEQWAQARAVLLDGEHSVHACILISECEEAPSALRSELEHYRIMAEGEPLSGLYNRAAMEQKTDSVLHNCTCDQYPAFLLLDIDHFKQVNDTYGHPVGDEIIRQMGKTLRGTFRSTDILGRLGGDEFAVLIPHSGGRKLIEEKLAVVKEKLDKIKKAQVWEQPLSVSVGIAYRNQARSFEDAYAQADIALYQAKECGRNQAAWYGADN